MEVLDNSFDLPEHISYSIKNNYPVGALFRPGSKLFFENIKAAIELYNKKIISFSEDEKAILELDIGVGVSLECGSRVSLDLPIPENNIVKYKDINSPSNISRLFKVYYKDKKGEINKLEFSDDIGATTQLSSGEISKEKELFENFVNDKSKPEYWQYRIFQLRRWYRPRREGGYKAFPYSDSDFFEDEESSGLIRSFPADSGVELSWHTDGAWRDVEVIQGGGWYYQADNMLPIELTKGMKFKIGANEFHRGITGYAALVIHIKDYKEKSLWLN
jgi:hypothetical protein